MAATAAKKSTLALEGVTLEQVLDAFIGERSAHWKESRRNNILNLFQPPGQTRTGRERKPGPLWSILHVKLVDLDEQTIKQWVLKEAKERPLHTRNAFLLLESLKRWIETSRYKGLLKPYSNEIRRLYVPRGKPKQDSLLREHLPAFFESLSYQLNASTRYAIAALLLTGCRKNELLKLKWADVDFKWKTIKISDKVEGGRVIPLTPYVEWMLNDLQRKNEFVFSSTRSEAGYIANLRFPLAEVCKRADVPFLSVHGLRRSYGSLAEWIDVPAGVVAQLMGHKPSATAEKHYRVRPLDLLRDWATKIEKWILEQAQVEVPVNQHEPQELSAK